MSQLRITNESKLKDIYFEGKSPFHEKTKIKKWEDTHPSTLEVNLGNAPKVKFSLYREDNKPAKYKNFIFTIGEPHKFQNVNISIKKSDDDKELITEWESTEINYGKQKKVNLPPENVSVGVKE